MHILVIHALHQFDDPCHYLLVHIQYIQIIHLIDYRHLLAIYHIVDHTQII